MTQDPQTSPAQPGTPSDAEGVVHPWHRFVALGDSFTEGIGDPLPDGGHRGWADRVAEVLASTQEDFSYANLAVRGRLLDQIRDEQTARALELQPDLISLCAGGNDCIRPGGDPDVIAARLEALVSILATSGATILLFTGPDVGSTPVLGGVRGRVAIYNEHIRGIAARHDAVVADMWNLHELKAKPMWHADRLHFSPLGHQTIAGMALDALQVPHDLSPETVEAEPVRAWREARVDDLRWARQHLVPWVVRRLRNQSSGDGILPKRPHAVPLYGESMPLGSHESEIAGE
ncbi:SGNH/GDSL hydrolase family protein [Falsarthrobacter nasiphocae]|uniref:Lysophospholipase L1-like esterase n=1 Tax=Falsarthrobacter nasiphocae TaxID=189863 RepID=A0AAE4C7J6_9MICC|nr:SGNH/GDSL hydrolase family protein [Falsarthrobacter nasiphocae]MDR6892614.1 lysophospholipase L1-like esterase [Falsarthrobacter nasiphocae]